MVSAVILILVGIGLMVDGTLRIYRGVVNDNGILLAGGIFTGVILGLLFLVPGIIKIKNAIRKPR